MRNESKKKQKRNIDHTFMVKKGFNNTEDLCKKNQSQKEPKTPQKEKLKGILMGRNVQKLFKIH